MARIARSKIQTSFFHNMTQGINKEYIFQKDAYKNKYINFINDAAISYSIQVIAFTIMDNHAHLLIHTENIKNMSLFMKQINEKFASYYNHKNDRVGVVFRNRYKSQPIVTERQLDNCIKYIFFNPVRAKIVSSPEEYLYSNSKDFNIKKYFNNLINKIDIDYNDEAIDNQNFIDTNSDRIDFIKELINKYVETNNLTLYRSAEDMKKLVKYIKTETNISNRIIAEILSLSKSSINNYLKVKDEFYDTW